MNLSNIIYEIIAAPVLAPLKRSVSEIRIPEHKANVSANIFKVGVETGNGITDSYMKEEFLISTYNSLKSGV